MRVDSNTNGHRQWFYFSMKNDKKMKVKFNIYRFKKVYSLFQRGMRPYIRSRKSGEDWKAGGDNICYHYERQRNEYGLMKEVKSFVLTFNYQFQHENDEVFVCAGIPYTYSFLQKQLQLFRESCGKRQNLNFEISALCKTMCGLDLQLINIEHKMVKLIHSTKDKKFIVINARTHSGETSSSWVLDGLIEEISNSPMIEEWMLAENICFKIIPMLNPDGVFIGNYRTGIIGDDFNRKFNTGRKQYYPQIFALKKVVNTCKKDGTIQLFLDLHGHSILKNSFIYGPSQKQFTEFRLKHLPYNLFHHSKYFRLGSCKFKSQKQNIETARVYFQFKQNILSFTCENSLGLYYSQRQTFQMMAGDWKDFGRSIIHQIRNISVNKTETIVQKSERPTFFANATQKCQSKLTGPCEIQQKLQQKTKFDPSKTRGSKIHFRIPQINKKNSVSIEKGDMRLKNAVSYSQQIEREDQIVGINEQFKLEKIENIQKKVKNDYENNKFKIRRKSQIMKVPLQDHFIKKELNPKKTINSHKQEAGVPSDDENFSKISRSLTSDNDKQLKKQIQKINQNQEYDMKTIHQNFSQEYSSINDSDSVCEDLPDQAKKYIFQYIKMNQKQNISEQDELQIPILDKQRTLSKEPKISKFREIRFKHIDEEEKQATKNSLKKNKIETNKFKQHMLQTLKGRNAELISEQFDDPSIVTISQQKKLNERVGQHRRTQKDPFVLIKRKEKTQEKGIDTGLPF